MRQFIEPRHDLAAEANGQTFQSAWVEIGNRTIHAIDASERLIIWTSTLHPPAGLLGE